MKEQYYIITTFSMFPGMNVSAIPNNFEIISEDELDDYISEWEYCMTKLYGSNVTINTESNGGSTHYFAYSETYSYEDPDSLMTVTEVDETVYAFLKSINMNKGGN